MNTNDFYGSGLGSRLIDPKNFSPEIAAFLDVENRLVLNALSSFECLIEVGCMQGRYIERVLRAGKYYIGIDLVERYINTALLRASSLSLDAKRYSFFCLGASRIHDLIQLSQLSDFGSGQALVVFPFNSFGNIEDVSQTMLSLMKSKSHFFISTYKTDSFSSSVRRDYYGNCNYSGLRQINETNGIRFISNDGLNTMAYSHHWLVSCFGDFGFQLRVVDIGPIGIGFMTSGLAK
jgi:hypothetical protein